MGWFLPAWRRKRQCCSPFPLLLVVLACVELLEPMPINALAACDPLLSDVLLLTVVDEDVIDVAVLLLLAVPFVRLTCCPPGATNPDISGREAEDEEELEEEVWVELDTLVAVPACVPRNASADGLGMLRMEAFGCRTVKLRWRLISVSFGSGASVFCTPGRVWKSIVEGALVDDGKLIISGRRFTGVE